MRNRLGVRKMHAHEVHTDVALVLGLLEAQFPDWASLPLERLQTADPVV